MDHQNNPPHTHNELLSKHTNTFKLNKMFHFSRGKFFHLGLELPFNYFSTDSPLKWVQKWNRKEFVQSENIQIIHFARKLPVPFLFFEGEGGVVCFYYIKFFHQHILWGTNLVPLNSIFWWKTQFCLISSLCRAQSLRLSIPPPLLKTPHRELCTNPANSSLETNLLFTDKYLFRYLPRKHERQTQHLDF